MAKSLGRVTRQDALVASASHVMNILYAAIATRACVVPCLEVAEHYCSYDRMVEIGWLERCYDKGAPAGACILAQDGADAFCKQYLEHGFATGPVVDLVNEVFDKSSQDLNDWKDIVRETKLAEEITGT